MKSIGILSHFHSSILRGCSSPMVFYLGDCTCWHTRHLLTCFTISFFILRHQKCCFRSWYIFVPPGCIEKGELCALVRSSFFISLTARTHKRTWHNSPSSVDLEKPPTGPTINWSRISFRHGSSHCESMILCLSVGRTVSRPIWAITCWDMIQGIQNEDMIWSSWDMIQIFKLPRF